MITVLIFAAGFVNIFLLLYGLIVFLKYLAPLPKTLTALTSILLSLTALSFLYFLMLALHQQLGFLLIVLCCINAVQLYWSYPKLKTAFNFKSYPINRSEIIVPLAAVLLMAILFLFQGVKYGGYDSWAIWNTHAKFLYNPEIWTRMFRDETIMSHADYPLMLPSLVAFFWNITNNTSFTVPLLFSFFVVLLIVLLAYLALREDFQNKVFAYFGLFLLVADYNFQSLDSIQCADALLSLFILMAFVLNNRTAKDGSSNVAYVTGFICASCTWIKNEGVIFCAVFSLVFLIANFRRGPVIKKYILGSMLPLIITVYFKIAYAPTNDLIAANEHQKSRITGDLMDLSRYSTIAEMLVKTTIEYFWFGNILLLLLILFNRRFFKSPAFAVFFILLSCFIVIYLVTPYDLGWHLSTSLSRILYQVYPAFLYSSIFAFGEALSKKPDFELKLQ